MIFWCRYWGEEDSNPKSMFTLEALHRLADQRSRERGEKRQLQDSKADSDGNTSSGRNEEETCMGLKEMGLYEKSMPRRKRLKRSSGTDDSVKGNASDFVNCTYGRYD